MAKCCLSVAVLIHAAYSARGFGYDGVSNTVTSPILVVPGITNSWVGERKQVFVTNFWTGEQKEVSFTLPSTFEPLEAGKLEISSQPTNGAFIMFSRGADRYLFRAEPDLMYTQPVASKDGRTVVFLVDRYRGLGGDGTLAKVELGYVGLTEFSIPASSNSLTQITRRQHLNPERLRTLIGTRRAWVVGIREISSEADSVLLDIRVELAGPKPFGIQYLRKPYRYWLRKDQLTEVKEKGPTRTD